MSASSTAFPKVHIYMPSILDAFREDGVDTNAMFRQVAGFPECAGQRYPDGSMQIEGPQAVEVFEKLAVALFRKLMANFHAQHPFCNEYVMGGAAYISLNPFEAKSFDLSFCGEFVRKFENGCVGIWPNFVPDLRPTLEENPIDDLPVTVIFQRRLSKDAREQFSRLVGDWLRSVSGEGIFGEGPILPVSGEIDFYPRCAQFRINASRSGQNTINWLILTILRFIPVNLVTEILLMRRAATGQPVAEEFSLNAAQLVKLPLVNMVTAESAVSANNEQVRGATTAAGAGVPRSESESHVPPEAKPYEGVQAEHFRILALPSWHVENLMVRIYFEEFPKPAERKPFQESIRSWLNLGSQGAFGGSGFDAHNEVALDKETASARFWCDIGVTDWDLAFRVLVNLLESWHRQGIAIEAVVLSEGTMEA